MVDAGASWRPIPIKTPLEWAALRLWRKREAAFPRFVRHGPDAFDLAMGTWDRALDAAERGLDEIP